MRISSFEPFERLVDLVAIRIDLRNLVGRGPAEAAGERLQRRIRFRCATLDAMDHREGHVAEDIVRFGFGQCQGPFRAALKQTRDRQERVVQGGVRLEVERELKRHRGLVEALAHQGDHRGLAMRARRKRIERNGLADQLQRLVDPPQDPFQLRRRAERVGVARGKLHRAPE